MATAHTRETLCEDLRELGVQTGDTLFIHSSFKSLGPVDGGAGTVVAALEDSVGPDGLILMPNFNLVDWPKRQEQWDLETAPSTVGWLTEYFRHMPGTYRSDHYSHSVAARGNGAREFVADHLSREGLRARWDREPWGNTYGTNSPMFRAYIANGKLFMLGVDYESSTYCHVAEAIFWNRRLEQDPAAEFRYLLRPALGEFWDRNGVLRRERVGNADCRLFHIRTYVDALVQEIDRNPDPYWVR